MSDNRYIRFWFWLMVLLPGVGFSQSMPLAEAILTNQATATFQLEAAEDVVYSVVSNTVEVRIEPVEALILLEDQVRLQRAGRWVYFDHTLINAGNVASEYRVEFANAPNSDYQFTDLSILVEESAAKLPAGLISTKAAVAEHTIEPGKEQFIRAQAFVPLEVSRAQVGRLNLVVKTTLQEFQVQNRDSVYIQAGTVLEINKINMTPASVQGEELIFQINGRNSGDVAALAINHLIDGRPARNVIVRDRIPANTTFKRFISSGSYRELYHYYGTALHDYRTVPPPDQSDIDAVAWAIPIIEVAGTFSFTFGVDIAPNANGAIVNTADVYYNDGLAEEMKASASNQVVQLLPAKDAEIDYFTGIEFETRTRLAKVGEPLFVQASAAACNLNAAWADTADITITSQVSGDMETFRAYETTRNSGVFQILPEVETRDFLVHTPISGNTVLEIGRDDVLIAELQQCGVVSSTRVRATVLVDPKGVVFDSESNRPIPGARVRLIDVTGEANGGNPGGPAKVWTSGGDNEVSAEQVTGEDGSFEMPNVNPSTYRFEVEVPTGYQFPSVLTPAQLPATRTIGATASFGGNFVITEPNSPLAFDIPLDINGVGAMKMEKVANRQVVEIGEQVGYTIKVTNLIFSTIEGVVVHDKIPHGFSFVAGSARLDSVRIDDPVYTGGFLVYQLGDLEVSQTKVLTYRLKAGPLAINGDGENTAIASAPELIEKISNKAAVKIIVTSGMFSEDGFIGGKVFHDRNQNRMQDKGEPGIAGARVFLENGNFVITDAYGRYTFFGIPARKHVLKLDVESLPKGGRVEVIDNRNANDGSSRFVDLKKGEFHKADFAICACDGSIDEEVASRRAQILALDPDWVAAVEQRLDPNAAPAARNQRMLPAQGFVGAGREVRFDPVNKADETERGRKILELGVTSISHKPIEDVITSLSNQLGFVDYADGDTLAMSQATVRVKGRTNSDFVLYINSVEISEDRVGKRASTDAVEAWEFVGVKFTSGVNEAKVVTLDPFGNRRDSVSIQLIAPGSVAKMQVLPEEDGIPADGASKVKIKIVPVDENGVPVKTRVAATLEASAGTWEAKDLDPNQPGVQVFIVNGAGYYELRSPMDPADVTIRATNGSISGEGKISFVPNLRELIAAGIIEGTIRLRDRSIIQGVEASDDFEREIRELSVSSGKITADARAAFFLKGKVRGKYLLTAGYDSERDNEGMFRDIQPDEFYPVYGEASVKGFDAQSTGRLFVKVERNKSYALYGDYQTTDMHPAQMLGLYNRSLTGAKWHFENNRFRANAWLSNAESNQIIELIPALGISGPYALRNREMVVNSERVEIITFDRNQPDVIIKTELMTRFTDYTVEPFSGSLMFRAPVRSIDNELNPRYIRVVYEVVSGGKSYWVAGGDAQVKLGKNIEIGGTLTQDSNPADAYSLRSVNATVKLGAATLITEVAQSDLDSKGTDVAGRFEVKYQGKSGDGRIFAGKAGENFQNPFATLGAGRTEGGMRGSYQIGSNNMIQAEALYSRNDTSGMVRSGGMVRYQRNLTKNLQFELGARHMQNDSLQTTTMRTKLLARLPGVRSAQAYGEYEQSIAESARRIAAVGGEYQLGSRGRLYARHEFLSSIKGPYALNDQERQNNTMIGVDASYMKDGQVFSEYRIREGLDGRQAQAAMGVRNKFTVSEGFGITTSLERVFSISGRAVNEGTAVAVGADYTKPTNWKATARQEVRFSPQGDMMLNTLGYGRKIDNNWTFLGKNVLAIAEDPTGGTRLQERLRLGMAYRDFETSRWNSLMRYEIKFEDMTENGLESKRLVHMVSNHSQYQATEKLVLSSQVAVKTAKETFDNFQTRNVLELMGLRAIYDVNKRWDVGVHGSVMATPDFAIAKSGLGVEAGFIIATNLRLAAGYNLFGYRDRDLSEVDYTDQGVYLGFSYKFDERLIQKMLRTKPVNTDVYESCPPVDAVCEAPEVAGFLMPEIVIEPLPFTPITALSLGDLTFNLPSSIHFALNQSSISQPSAHMLDRIADYMMQFPDQKLTIVGHTDSRNTFDYNLKLSMRRSDAAKAYLIAAGISEDRIVTEAKSKNQLAIAEQSLVNEAENRRVEFTLSPARPNVRMVNQIEDIQNETKELPNYEEWGFLMYTSHNAVPDRVNFDDNSDRISDYVKIAVDRVVLVMDRDTSLRLKLVAYQNGTFEQAVAQDRMKAIMQLMEDEAIASHRITIDLLPYTASAMNETDLASIRRSVFFEFATPNNLTRMFQTKDVLGKDADNVPKAITRVVELQKNRNDYAILGDTKPSHYLPTRVHFDANSDKVDHKTQAVIARVASYMNANRNVTVELGGMVDSDTPIGQATTWIKRRAELVRLLLVSAGVDASRITVNETVNLSPVVESNETEKARNRRIDFKFSGSDLIQTVDQRFDLKTRAGSAPQAPITTPRTPQ